MLNAFKCTCGHRKQAQLSLTNRATHLYICVSNVMQWRHWPPKTRPSHVITLNLVAFTSTGVDISIRKPQKLGRWAFALRWGRGWPLKRPVLHMLPCRIWLLQVKPYGRRHSSSERSERFVRFEPNVRSERVRYFSERETNMQALKRLINLIAVK